MLISNFELLVKAITPIPNPPSVDRTVVQAYFLTVSNLDEDDPVTLDVCFTATSPDLSNAFTFFDILGPNQPQALNPLAGNPKKSVRTITLPACDTGQLLLAPNVPALLPASDYEVRGYVEILVNQGSEIPDPQLLVTPEYRGTFLPENIGDPPRDLDFDQLSYTVPIAGGDPLIHF